MATSTPLTHHPSPITSFRIGYGYDVHRLVAERPLVLGGVSVPSDVGLDGHSDADVLAHAIADSVLGAAALGDIGTHFPDSDPRWKGADSLELLRRVVELVSDAGWVVGNVDATLILERPKVRAYVGEMRGRLAEALGVDVSAVSIKATTGEGLGFEGRHEGAAAHAVCIVVARA
jgi:2-C-methyl-D-erythritol 2,4-cyclodiphosphate synthase